MPRNAKSEELGIDWDHWRREYERGMSARQIAKRVGVSHTVINRRVALDGWKPSKQAWKQEVAKTETARRIAEPKRNGDKMIATLGNRTPENMATILQAIESGMAIERSAGLVGMAPSGLRTWIKEDPSFQKLIIRAASKKEERWIRKIDDSKAWQAAAWQLEHDRDTKDAYTSPREGGAGIIVQVNLRDHGGKTIDG